MTSGKWPNGTRAAIVLTFDNMGEAADLTRNLWPEDKPIGDHFSVRSVLPRILGLLDKYKIDATYFIESWNLSVYPDAIKTIADAGHEIGWHSWRHEAWHKYKADAEAEQTEFRKSFGEEGLGGFHAKQKSNHHITYRGFRPPGGLINGERTLQMCKEHGIAYISPCAQQAASIRFNHGSDSMLVLPFRWRTVDAYYYLKTFAKLREIKSEFSDPEPVQSPDVMVERFIAEIDDAIEKGEYRSILFHPFLNDSEEKLTAMETVLKHVVRRRDEGKIWLTRCQDVEEWVRTHPDCVGSDPLWDYDTK